MKKNNTNKNFDMDIKEILKTGKKYDGYWVMVDDSHQIFNRWLYIIANGNSYIEYFYKNEYPNLSKKYMDQNLSYDKKMKIAKKLFKEGKKIIDIVYILGMSPSNTDLKIAYGFINKQK